jgi:arylsulfatase B
MRIQLSALGLLGLLAAPLAAQTPRNVLLVMADDLGTDKLALYQSGAAVPPTPTLDALAGEGVLFRNAWACPVCSPTRATLQTGRYPFRHGVGTAIPFGPPLPRDELCLPAVLDRARELGGPTVATAAIGKWHLAAVPGGNGDPLRRGYDHFAGSNLGALTGPFDYFFWPESTDGVTQLTTDYATTAQVDAALAWIEQQNGPWFCYLAFHAPHTPFHAPPAELHTRELPDAPPEQDPVPYYEAMVEALDTELGRLLASLDPQVRAATTILVVGDNGTTGDVVLPPYDPQHGKGSLYQGGVRVPLIASGAGIAAPGREVAALVDVSDLFATVLELCGADWRAALPAGLTIDSVSLLPYLQQPLALPQRQWVLSQSIVPWLPPALSAGSGPFGGALGGGGLGAALGGLGAGAQLVSGVTLRNAVHKLIRYDNGVEELYNLLLDPQEQLDLLALPSLTPNAQAAYDELTATLDGLLSQP